MDDPTCKHCIHFYQHYVLDDHRALTTQCGHCVYPQVKHRRPDTAACQFYEARSFPAQLPDRGETIRFLTTKMLDYILSLDLPPDLK